jgi:peptide chain release factor 1
MHSKLEEIERRYDELQRKIAQPEVATDVAAFREAMKSISEMQDVVAKFRELKSVRKRLVDAREMLRSDDEMRELAQVELAELEPKEPLLEQEIRVLLQPKDPNDEKNVFVEIRAGTGGDEASLFAAEVMRMYIRYAESKRWKVDITDANYSAVNGIKDATLEIDGNKVYSRLKFESGVHRVQRVPATEAQGRIHTSTATVAVLPEAEEMDLVINDEDLKIDVYRAGGHGGQGVNTTDSAVRITHLPTGEVVICQDERSQLKNKTKAMAVLRSRLLARAAEERDARESSARNAQIGRGERSEKMRTYNFPQDRLTDRRLGYNLSNLDRRMDGDIDDLVAALSEQDEADRLSRLEEDGD